MSFSGSTPTYATNIEMKTFVSVSMPMVLPLSSRVERMWSLATSSTQPVWAAARIVTGAPASTNRMSVGVNEKVMSTSPARRVLGRPALSVPRVVYVLHVRESLGVQQFLRDDLRCNTGKSVFVDPQPGRLWRRLRIRDPEIIAKQCSGAGQRAQPLHEVAARMAGYADSAGRYGLMR